MRIACVDIGSNTTRLLVAEPGAAGEPLREVLTERAFTRLGGAGARIPPAKVEEVAATVAAQVRQAREAGAGAVHAVATAAIRAAENRDELCAAVSRAAGVPVSILSGEEEARLAFLGAMRTLDDAPAGTVAVVDVGGGSTEIVCGTAGDGVAWAESFPVGSALLTDRHVRSDPPSAGELDAIRTDVAGVLAAAGPPPRARAAFAVGGSATSLRRMVGPVLDHETLGRAVAVLCDAPAEEIAARYDLHVERVRVLPAGMLLLDAAGACLGLSLQVARGGLREGVLLDHLDERG